ncbi:MAG: hypothetical protein KF812_03265 [Fimbriimonadaceae bacterium]|nr:hypothetical protein [Fimbriimonadaceae bacterium]
MPVITSLLAVAVLGQQSVSSRSPVMTGDMAQSIVSMGFDAYYRTYRGNDAPSEALMAGANQNYADALRVVNDKRLVAIDQNDAVWFRYARNEIEEATEMAFRLALDYANDSPTVDWRRAEVYRQNEQTLYTLIHGRRGVASASQNRVWDSWWKGEYRLRRRFDVPDNTVPDREPARGIMMRYTWLGDQFYAFMSHSISIPQERRGAYFAAYDRVFRLATMQ